MVNDADSVPGDGLEFTVEAYLNDTERRHDLKSAEDYVEDAKNGFASLDILRERPEDWAHTTVVYRGQVDSAWGLSSSLSRVLSVGGQELTEKRLSEAERKILTGARRGWGNPSADRNAKNFGLGRNLGDGQLLAVLQHQESPTRFIDVTRSSLISLYFACEREDTRDGRVFVIVFRDVEGGETDAWSHASETDPRTHPEVGESPGSCWLSLDGTGLPWPQTETERYAPGYWSARTFLVDAGVLDPRMSAQEGLFMVGGLARTSVGRQQYWAARRGRTNLRAEEIKALTAVPVQLRTSARGIESSAFSAYARTVRIPAALKPEIRNLLREEGIGAGSMYPDYAGFRRLAYEIARGNVSAEE